MILELGSYRFLANEASVSINRTGMSGDNKIIYAWQETWQIGGRLLRDTVTELSAAIRDLESVAKTFGGADVRLLFDDGSPTEHLLRSVETLNGIHIVGPPSWPVSEGAEYVTYRTFQMTIQAEVGIRPGGIVGGQGGGPGQIIEWRETISISGGHPLDRFLVLLNGAPVRQRVSPQVPYVGVQQGRAVGLVGYPAVPTNVFAGAAIDSQVEEYVTPEETLASNQVRLSNFPVSWVYRVQSESPLFARPRRPLAVG